uniref:Uncharacterized protein n=1 Tax=Opuntia streptacantha TaxID=393608 RepID=A0A7C9A8U0_OPUST
MTRQANFQGANRKNTCMERCLQFCAEIHPSCHYNICVFDWAPHVICHDFSKPLNQDTKLRRRTVQCNTLCNLLQLYKYWINFPINYHSLKARIACISFKLCYGWHSLDRRLHGKTKHIIEAIYHFIRIIKDIVLPVTPRQSLTRNLPITPFINRIRPS